MFASADDRIQTGVPIQHGLLHKGVLSTLFACKIIIRIRICLVHNSKENPIASHDRALETIVCIVALTSQVLLAFYCVARQRTPSTKEKVDDPDLDVRWYACSLLMAEMLASMGMLAGRIQHTTWVQGDVLRS